MDWSRAPPAQALLLLKLRGHRTDCRARPGRPGLSQEPNSHFEPAQHEEAAARNFTAPRQSVWITGEEVDVTPASFDAAVLTHVLCSVSDPVAVLRQAARALRPGGRVFVLEHVAAEEGSSLRSWQHLFQPIFTIVGNGCHFRQLAALLREETFDGLGKFSITDVEAPLPLPILRPHILATATKQK